MGGAGKGPPFDSNVVFNGNCSPIQQAAFEPILKIERTTLMDNRIAVLEQIRGIVETC